MLLAEFNQKTTKDDLFVKRNYGIPPRNQRGKTLEDSRRRITEVEHMSLTCGAGRPHLEATRPVGPPMLASHCYVGSPPPPRLHLRYPLSQFDPRAHVGRFGLYILAPATPSGAILKP